MMSSENIPPVVQPPDHGHHNSTTTTTTTASARKSAAQKLPEPPPLKCPRCDSANTKFCYYNNYSLTQPRHFCKTCRRYWTKGGALRNVPIGGGCRKAKKHKPLSSSSSSSCPNSSSPFCLDLSTGPGGGADFKFLAPQTMTPAMEFQLGGLSLPRLHPATAGVYTQFIASSGAQSHHQPPLGVAPGTDGCFGFNLLGLGSNNYPPTIPTSGNNSSSSSSSSLSLAGGSGGGSDQPLTISSIESLSSINQEMHWKLQQQRLAMMYGQSSVEDDNNNNNINDQDKSLEGINLFKNLESARHNNKLELAAAGPTPTEWLFEHIPANYGATDNHKNNNNSSVGVSGTTTSCNNNNNHEGFNGVWTTELHHQRQFTGLQ